MDTIFSSGKKEPVYTNACKQLLIFRPPAVLTLHMKRFQQVGFSLRKVNRHVEFPMVLDLAPFCSALCQVSYHVNLTFADFTASDNLFNDVILSEVKRKHKCHSKKRIVKYASNFVI